MVDISLPDKPIPDPSVYVRLYSTPDFEIYLFDPPLAAYQVNTQKWDAECIVILSDGTINAYPHLEGFFEKENPIVLIQPFSEITQGYGLVDAEGWAKRHKKSFAERIAEIVKYDSAIQGLSAGEFERGLSPLYYELKKRITTRSFPDEM